MAIYPAPTNLSLVGSGFNTTNFSGETDTGNFLTSTRGDLRYLQLTGGTVAGPTIFQQGTEVFGTLQTEDVECEGSVSCSTLSIAGSLFPQYDTSPTSGSVKLLTSGSLYTALQGLDLSSSYLTAAAASSTYAPLANPSISGTLRVDTIQSRSASQTTFTTPISTSTRIDAPIVGTNSIQLYSGTSLTLPTLGTTTVNGTLTATNVTTSAQLLGKTFALSPTAWNSYTTGSTSGSKNANQTLFNGTFTAGLGSITFPTISLTGAPSSGVIIGSIQMWYSNIYQTVKTSINTWSCLGSLQTGAGIKGVSATLGNALANPISVTLNYQNNVPTVTIVGNVNSVPAFVSIITNIGGFSPSYPSGVYGATMAIQYATYSGTTQTATTSATLSIPTGSYASVDAVKTAFLNAWKARFPSNSATASFTTSGGKNRLSQFFTGIGASYIVYSNYGSSLPLDKIFWNAIGFAGNESIVHTGQFYYLTALQNDANTSSYNATYIDYQLVVIGN